MQNDLKPKNLFMETIKGIKTDKPPIWMMRQAGRYLPEYRALRAQTRSFLEFCYTPALAVEATLQPIKRFGFDAAILFSDILVVPDALGQKVEFLEGEGPRLTPVTNQHDLDRLNPKIDLNHLEPVFEAIKQVRASLAPQTALLGFCGAPWTVASYMVAGKSTPELAPLRIAAYRDPIFLEHLINMVVKSSIEYLVRQFQSGVNAVQIFESFAGALPPELFKKCSLEPIQRIIDGVRLSIPDAPILVFARGSGLGNKRVATETSATVIGLDWTVDCRWAAQEIQSLKPIQGNLDPLALVAGGDALKRSVDHILASFDRGPYIFNLGHGIVPETPIDHVEMMIRRIRG